MDRRICQVSTGTFLTSKLSSALLLRSSLRYLNQASENWSKLALLSVYPFSSQPISLLKNNRVLEDAYRLDLDLNNVAILQLCLGILEPADARRGARHDGRARRNGGPLG